MLDEIGDLPMSLQAKLLRFIQERSIERVGGRQEIPVDVRIVCATHQDLGALAKEGRFREDLYYRLAEIVINIPPLRERVGDAALAGACLRAPLRAGAEPRLAEPVRRRRARHRGALVAGQRARAVELHQARVDHGRRPADHQRRPGAEGVPKTATGDDAFDLRAARDAAEKRTILAALGRANGNIAKAAELLGVSRPTLYDLMHRLSLK